MAPAEGGELVWKALADPTRRAILDLLRDGPQTTGDLAGQFSMTRFGVMKHLRVLEDAQLVLVRREGRKRFNHINAVPIQKFYERWVHQYSRPHARSLTALENHLRATRSPIPSPHERQDDMTDSPNLSFHIEQEIELKAPVETVWRALTHEVGKWWGYHIGPKDSSITLEPRVAGHFIERWGDGEGELYATVTYVRQGKKITMEGGLGMAGPGYSKFSYTLEPKGNTTLLKLTHYCHGYRDPDVKKSYTEGWNELLTQNLPAWVHEGRVAT